MIDRDPGLAAERTSLAWQRTGIAIIAAGLAEIRGLPHRTELSGRPLIGLAIAGFGIFSFVAFLAHPPFLEDFGKISVK